MYLFLCPSGGRASGSPPWSSSWTSHGHFSRFPTVIGYSHMCFHLQHHGYSLDSQSVEKKKKKKLIPAMSLRSWALSNFLWIHGKAIHAEAESECMNSWPELNCYAFGLFGLNPILYFEQHKQKNTRLIDRLQTNTTDKLLTIASDSSTEIEHLLFIEHLLDAQNYLIILPMLSSPFAGPTANSKVDLLLPSSAFYSRCNWDSPKWRSLFGITQLLRVELRFEHSLQMQNPKMIPGEGNGTPLQYSCLENPMDRGAW